MRTATTTLAAAALLAVGATAGAALSARPDQTPAAVAPVPVEVRTQVVHRTVHVVRHIKPKRPKRATAVSAPAPAVLPARAQPVVATVAPRSARPLRTRSSATGSGGGEREHEHESEGGGDD